jgi:hypothetical protein
VKIENLGKIQFNRLAKKIADIIDNRFCEKEVLDNGLSLSTIDVFENYKLKKKAFTLYETCDTEEEFLSKLQTIPKEELLMIKESDKVRNRIFD